MSTFIEAGGLGGEGEWGWGRKGGVEWGSVLSQLSKHNNKIAV